MSPQQQLTPERTDASTADDQAADATSVAPPFPYGENEETALPYGGSKGSIAPGRRGPDTCPDCGGTANNAQGVFDCEDCDWSGTR